MSRGRWRRRAGSRDAGDEEVVAHDGSWWDNFSSVHSLLALFGLGVEGYLVSPEDKT